MFNYKWMQAVVTVIILGSPQVYATQADDASSQAKGMSQTTEAQDEASGREKVLAGVPEMDEIQKPSLEKPVFEKPVLDKPVFEKPKL
jgi:hypothetical protein